MGQGAVFESAMEPSGTPGSEEEREVPGVDEQIAIEIGADGSAPPRLE